MVPTSLEPGHVLAGRFAIVGVLGSGGTASVYLAVDQLRGERVALKVVHPHLASDPSVQRRIRKEIAAASLLTTDTVLVPRELHELDGFLCLTLPYHPGQTLTEHVAANGPLPLDDVRDLGIRMASALEQAHRQGLLHRDVTANNVMLDHGRNALLMDFGLARAETSTTRSTGMLGTTGYAAPEVYAGEPADPRTDLYGLGCVLYLATTGKLPFHSDHAMGTLQRQLAEQHTPVRELRADCPDDLAHTIEQLLRRERSERPTSAGELATSLRDRTATVDEVVPSGRAAHLQPGGYRVVVQERDEDRNRRRMLRVSSGKAPKTFETEVTKQAKKLWTGLLTTIGMHEEEGEQATPEDLLRRAVLDEAHLDGPRLRSSQATLQKRFILVDGVSKSAAQRIAADSRTAGFKARPHGTVDGIHPGTWMFAALLAMVILPVTALLPPLGLVLLALAVPSAVAPEVVRRLLHRQLDELPVAYTAHLDGWLDRPTAGRFAVDAEADAPSVAVGPPVTARPFLARALSSLDALDATADSLDFPDVIRSDLHGTSRDLRDRANLLADALERVDAELARDADDHSWVEPRLARMRTKKRAGEAVDDAELLHLQGLLRAWEGHQALEQQLESKRTAATAGLLEIAATATSVRREILAAPDTASVQTRSLERLQAEARAAQRAQREVAR